MDCSLWKKQKFFAVYMVEWLVIRMKMVCRLRLMPYRHARNVGLKEFRHGHLRTHRK